MCQINMDGMPSSPEYAEVFVPNNVTGQTSLNLQIVPKHSRCLASPGSYNYFCRCEKPFLEDMTLEHPNCRAQEVSCDSILCLHGTCMTTANRLGKAVCVCYAGYDGPRCDQKVTRLNSGNISSLDHRNIIRIFCFFGALNRINRLSHMVF